MGATWIMVIMMHVGALGNGNSNALTTATFKTESACKEAESKVKALARGTVKSIETVCLKGG